MPATLGPRRRRRRFPERELLERLRRYEDMLRQNDIKFEPLHKNTTGEKESTNEERGYESDDDQREAGGADGWSPSTTVKSERVCEAKYVQESISRWLIFLGTSSTP